MTRITRSTIPLLLLGAALLTLLNGCDRLRSNYRTLQGGVWNTVYNITYNSPADLTDSILTVMRQVELSLSPFCDSSLITLINRGGPSVIADTLLRRIFEASLTVNRASGGAFDPTVAPLVNLWGFGYKKTGIEPSQQSIDSLRQFVGIADCRIDSEGHLLKKSPSTEFNFSAITKGYGCDLIGEMLRRNGCMDFLVEIGGEIAAAGKNPRGEMWRIMIDAPVSSDSAVVHEEMAVVEISGVGVATSGNYRNFHTDASGRSWHTISPATGRPAVTDLLSATVVAPSAMLADAFATSCMAMSADSALTMINRIPGVEALLVTLNPSDSTYILSTSPGFPKRR